MKGTWSSRGTAGAACNNVAAQYSGTCGNYGGTYNGSQCVWTKFSGSGGTPGGSNPEGDNPEGDNPEGDDPEGGDPEGGDPEGGDPGGTGPTGNSDNSNAKGRSLCPDGQVYTSLFGGCISADSNSVFTVLNVILQVLTWGIGIAGTIGIVIVGFQYMTARDDPPQMAKAKNRLIQIVIGLAIYAVMWAFLQWLLPGGVFGS
jgi:hypothetical protein